MHEVEVLFARPNIATRGAHTIVIHFAPGTVHTTVVINLFMLRSEYSSKPSFF